MTELHFGNMDDWHSDLTRERDGVPFDLERDTTQPLSEHRLLIVRRAGTRNRAFLAMAPLMQEHAAKTDDEDESDEHLIARHLAMARVCAHALVIGWRNIRDERGVDIPFTPRACEALLRYCPDVADRVLNFAVERAHFHAQESAQEIDTVKKTSGGIHARAPSSTT